MGGASWSGNALDFADANVHLYKLLTPLDWYGSKVLIVCHGGGEVPAQAWLNDGDKVVIWYVSIGVKPVHFRKVVLKRTGLN